MEAAQTIEVGPRRETRGQLRREELLLSVDTLPACDRIESLGVPGFAKDLFVWEAKDILFCEMRQPSPKELWFLTDPARSTGIADSLDLTCFTAASQVSRSPFQRFVEWAAEPTALLADLVRRLLEHDSANAEMQTPTKESSQELDTDVTQAETASEIAAVLARNRGSIATLLFIANRQSASIPALAEALKFPEAKRIRILSLLHSTGLVDLDSGEALRLTARGQRIAGRLRTMLKPA
jgi:hypothetical protein